MKESYTILIIDDDAFIRDMYAAKFSEEGCVVDVGASGEEALRKLKEKMYDAILLDMLMPGMDGLALLAAVKAGYAKTICIVLSNQGQDEEKKRAREKGADGYIIKANTVPSEVVAQVKAFLAEKKA